MRKLLIIVVLMTSGCVHYSIPVRLCETQTIPMHWADGSTSQITVISCAGNTDK